jgi:predicted phosphohydrolase
MIMKLLVASDLHIEFHRDLGKSLINSLDNSCDVFCCAGDLAIPNLLEDGLRRICDRFNQTIFVCGNHEFYSSSFNAVYNLLDKLNGQLSNLHWLENNEVVLGGQRFLGATLWFKRQKDSLEYKHLLSDFGQIKDFEDLVFHKFAISRDYLTKQTKPGDIWISHHLPSLKCVNAKWVDSKLNMYFANDLDSLIRKKKPAYCFAGHTHDSCDLMIGQTRVVVNPFGYVGIDQNPNFNDNLVINVGE